MARSAARTNSSASLSFFGRVCGRTGPAPLGSDARLTWGNAAMKICVEFEYAAAGNVTLVNGKLTFPSLPTGPGIYRFRLQGAGVESISTYIGETDNLR